MTTIRTTSDHGIHEVSLRFPHIDVEGSKADVAGLG